MTFYGRRRLAPPRAGEKHEGAQCKDCAQNVNREIKGTPPWNVIHETGN